VGGLAGDRVVVWLVGCYDGAIITQNTQTRSSTISALPRIAFVLRVINFSV
jgi:hypothetical protein